MFFREFDEADEYCPGCDNHFYVEAEEKEEKVDDFETTSDFKRVIFFRWCLWLKRLILELSKFLKKTTRIYDSKIFRNKNKNKTWLKFTRRQQSGWHES